MIDDIKWHTHADIFAYKNIQRNCKSFFSFGQIIIKYVCKLVYLRKQFFFYLFYYHFILYYMVVFLVSYIIICFLMMFYCFISHDFCEYFFCKLIVLMYLLEKIRFVSGFLFIYFLSVLKEDEFTQK